MSASPSPYNPQYNFTNFQTSNPNTPLPAAQVDNEFANISTSNNQIINRLALIQNSDGTLGANCVSPQSLSADVLLLLASSSWPYLGAWVTGHAYVISNVVTQSSINYICVVAHTSGTFATDLANGDWVALTQASSTVTYPTGSIIANFSGSTMAPSAYTPIQIRNQIDLASVNVASASTTSIGGASSNSVTITGTTTITGFDIVAAGIIRYVTFSGSLTLTYNSTSLQLPGVANITTQAGDSAIFESLGSGNWKAISYQTASGLPLIYPTSQFSVGQITPSGTSQGSAASIGSNTMVIITSPTYGSNTALKLPAAVLDLLIGFVNPTSVDCTVFPQVSSSIDSLAANAGYVVPANSFIQFIGTSSTTWQSIAKSIKSGAPQVFTSSGTYTPTANMVFCDIEVLGAGGGGGTCNSSGSASGIAGGGGAGAYGKKRLTAAQVGTSAAVVIGTGGNGGSGGGNTTVTPSGTFSSAITGGGGSSGVGSNSQTNPSVGTGGAGGSASNTDVTSRGATGKSGFSIGSYTLSFGGIGADSSLGGGGLPGAAGTNTGGVSGGNATGYGAGGGAGASTGSGTGTGGVGSGGLAIITEYFY